MKNTTAAISICALYFTSSLPEMKTTTAKQEDHHKKNARGIMFSVTVWNRTILNCWAPVTPGSKFPNWNTKGMAVQRATHWDVEMVWKKNLGYWGILVMRYPQMIFSEHSCSVPSPEWLHVSPYLLSSCSSSEKNNKGKKKKKAIMVVTNGDLIHIYTIQQQPVVLQTAQDAQHYVRGKVGSENEEQPTYRSHSESPTSLYHQAAVQCIPSKVPAGQCRYQRDGAPSQIQPSQTHGL